MISKTAQTHPTAIIENGAQIADNVVVGPYCCVGPQVKLEENVYLVSHVSLSGDLTIGAGTKVYPFASLGHPSQDLKYKGEASFTVIGKNCTIREYVTIQPGTEHGIMKTTVGDNCLIMVGAHIAHDCVVGNNVIMANNATLGGHVTVGDFVIIGGLSAVQQRVRIGDHAIIGGMSGVEKDVIPYAMVVGERAYLNGLNIIGLKRRGFSNQTIQELMKMYDQLFKKEFGNTLAERIEQASTNSQDPAVSLVIEFIKQDTQRHLCLPKNDQ